MGDVRFQRAYEQVARSKERVGALRRMSDEAVVSALAWASTHEHDPLLANVLATEALNRVRRARVAFEHLAEGVIVVDEQGSVLALNPEATRKSGWTLDALSGASLCSRLHDARPDGTAVPPTECPIWQVLETGRVRYVEEGDHFRRSDGSFFPVAYAVAPVVHDHHLSGAVLVFRDVTERERMMEALREGEERWRILAEAATEGVVLHVGGRVEDANAAALAMFRLRREEAIGRDVLDFVAPEDRPKVRRAIQERREAPYSVGFVRGDGTSFAGEIRARTVPYRGREARVVLLRAAGQQEEKP